MPLVRERKIFLLGARTILQLEKHLLFAHKLKAAQALAAICESEHYATYTDAYIDPSNAADVQLLSDLKDVVLVDLTKDFANKKLVRPLVDAIDRAKRLSKK
jgi:hypothetical protein